jgi:hypothetical protein
MLALLILAVVVVLGALVLLVSRRMTRDDEHSVAGYHRQLHTLEHIKTHSADGEVGEGEGEAVTSRPALPKSAVRLSGSPYVRVTDGPDATPPPAVPPPPVADPDGVVTFDDATPVVVPSGRSSGGPETFSFGRKDRAMDSMNRRPRRMGGPIAAVAVVAVLIAVLVIAGSHKVTPPKHHGSTTATTSTSSRSHHAKRGAKKHVSTTTTTAAPLVSLPSATSLNDANYTTSVTSYSLVVSATNGPCYVQVDNVTTGTAMYATVMAAGQQETLAVHGPITIDVGAPVNFRATVNGDAVVLPYGYRTPFNLHLAPATGSNGASSSTTTTSSTIPG